MSGSSLSMSTMNSRNSRRLVHRYTEFPNLHDVAGDTASGPCDSQDIDTSVLLPSNIKKASIILSWAFLLRGYTNASTVVFDVDQSTVAIDFEGDALEEVEAENYAIAPARTAIYFAEPRVETPSIYLLVDMQASRATIITSDSTVPRSQIPSIVSQIQHILYSNPSYPSSPVNFCPDEWQEAEKAWSAEDGHLAVSELSMLNQKPQKVFGPELLHDLIGLTNEDPEMNAIEFSQADGSQDSLSYLRLRYLTDSFANIVANTLTTPRDYSAIPILLPQSPSLYVALISTLKAGAAFVPLNLDAPQERLRFVVDDVEATVVITNASFAPMFNWENGPKILLIEDEHLGTDDRWSATAGRSKRAIDPASPAYIMYTSGSTGTPKGVQISHSAATQSILAHDTHIPTFSRFLQFAAPTFDVSVFELFFPLFRGQTVVGCDRNRLLADLPGLITDLEIDAAELTPTVAGELLGDRSAVPNLRTLLTIGEMLTDSVIQNFGGGVLHGMYGPTEVAIHCTLATNFRRDAKVGDIGVPLKTVSAFIVSTEDTEDEPLEILPRGWVGELVLGGRQLADGYLKRQDLTEQAFIDTKLYGRLYRSGDRARILPSGRIECLGRVVAGQVKLRGQRVELGEVEQAVHRTPGVKSAAASVIGGSLVVHVSATQSTKKADIMRICRNWLPRFMLPSDIVVHDELPLLPSGKVDRKRLDEEYSARFAPVDEAEPEHHDDSNENETLITAAVEAILEIRPRVNDSLAVLGLDSIRAIRLASNLRKSGLVVDVFTIVNADTIAGIASMISQHPAENAEENAEMVEELFKVTFDAMKAHIPEDLLEDVQDIIPCTALQEAMVSETIRDETAYCNWILLSIPSNTEPQMVERAFYELVIGTEILRTGFLLVEDTLSQVIWKTPRKTQLYVLEDIEQSWGLSMEDLLEPPFSAGLILKDNGEKMINIHIHHALYDGWSWEHLQSDFQELLAGRTPTIRRSQFREVVKWELSRSDESKDAARQFWQVKLEGAGETKLPNFHGRVVKKSAVSVHSQVLHSSRSSYESAAKAAGVSPQVLAQSAWACLLAAIVGKEDVVFGNVVSGRTESLEGIEDIIGPTILTLPMRAHLGQELNGLGVLEEFQKINRELLQHSELGLRDIRRACGTDGTFDTLFVWQQTSNPRNDGAVKYMRGRDKLEFSFLLEVEPSGNEIVLKATYRERIVPTEQAQTVLKQLDALIRNFVENPNRHVRDLTTGIDHSLLSIENLKPQLIDPSSTRTLATIFEEAAAKYPENIALEMFHNISAGSTDSTEITYAELNAMANQLARELVEIGVVRDELVAICLEKSVRCYVGILAIVKAGAGYLPLTPDTPKERIRQIVASADVRVFMATSSVIRRIGPHGPLENVTFVDVDTVDADRHEEKDMRLPIPARNIAYAVFTSGSTGVPKGVLVEHEQAVGNFDVLAELYPTKAGDRFLQFCSIAFDVSVFEIFFTWSRGMTLCSATKDVLLRDLETAVNEMGVSHLSMTPTVAALINPDNVPAVKFLVTSGEAVTKKVFADWAGKGLWQGYGPSETTNICTVKPKVQKTDDISNIGRPFSNTSAFVVAPDVEDELVILPRGAVGELCFGGVQVCRGYLKMDELTQKKFMTHPIFGRIYRSGDIGRLLPSGDIMISGRQDDQVKIRGNRIELGEITSVLIKNALVADAATLVVLNEEVDANPQLISFVVLQNHRSNDFQAVQENSSAEAINELLYDVGQFLPMYMVPNDIIAVTTIPMTSQGKIDKRRLQHTYFEPESAGGDEESEEEREETPEPVSTENWTPHERAVAIIVAKNAKVDHRTITRDTSIFRLGLDSISAIYLSRQFGVAGFPKLDVSQIMKNHTVAAVAALLLENDKVAEKETSGALALKEFSAEVWDSVIEQVEYTSEEVQSVLPCTPLQQSMLNMSQSATDRKNAFNHTILELHVLSGDLRDAWNAAARANPILRTVFAVTSHPRHAYAQIVLKEHRPTWTTIQLKADDDLGTAIENYIITVSAEMTTIEPPYSFGVIRNHEKTILVMSFHHSLYDGFALDMLLGDVKDLYNKKQIPPRPSFEPFLEYLENIDLGAADEFWKDTLSGFEPSAFPDLTGKSASYKQNLTGMTSQRMVSSLDLDAINDGCKELSTSLLVLGQSAWARLLAAYTGEEDLCFGNIVSGRTVPVEGVEGIIAPCFNTVPVRVQMLRDTTNRALVDALQMGHARCMPYQLTPLRRIMTTMKTEGTRLFDTLFLLQPAKETSFDELWTELLDMGEMDFSMVVELVPSRLHNQLEIVLHFGRDILLEEHAHLILRQFDMALRTALKDTEALAMDFTGFGNLLLSGANPSPARIQAPGAGLLHSEFERIAIERPDHTAIEFLQDSGEISTLSFAELNILSNSIAHWILSLGVTRDEAIPLCMEKSLLYYTCMLAVLKAGCALTPIDPSFPIARKRFIVQELGARLVLSSGGSAEDSELFGIPVIDMDTLEELSGQPTTDPVVADLSDRNLVNRLYTSGSTGAPKAVAMEHRGAVQTIRACKTLIPWKPHSRLLQFAATTFDMCFYDCFMAWSYGFTLCTASRAHLLGALEQTIIDMRITMLDLTPTVASTLSADNLPNVKVLYCSGEAMPRKLVTDWSGRCLNSYGSTETAMCCTIIPVDVVTKSTNVGRPFSTTRFTVLSKDGVNVMPVFGSGELCIGGHQLAREYHANPTLTQSRFITHDEQRLYRSGDIARQLPDGTFEFIGRVDDQVKIRGLRVELDEISVILRLCDGAVADTTTMVLKHEAPESKEQLVSFLALEPRKQHGSQPVVSSEHTTLVATAREAAVKTLPRYMVPSVILVLDHIPMSATGKVNKKMLAAIFRQQALEVEPESAEEEQDWTPREQMMREVLAEISRVPVASIRKTSTIYELGLDSISAGQVAARLRKDGVNISVIDILQRPSIELLAEQLKEDVQVAEEEISQELLLQFQETFLPLVLDELPVTCPDPVRVYPCTAAQEGMLSQFITSDGQLYFNHVLMKLPAGFDAAKLWHAWQEVTNSLDILRTGFVEVNDTVHSFAAATYEPEAQELPWSTVENGTLESIAALKKKAAMRARDTLHLPPWQVVLIRNLTDNLLLFSGLHALYDATTLEIVFQDVAACYRSGAPPPQRPHFRNALAEIVAHRLDPEVVEADKEFWTAHLVGSTIARMPNLCPLRVSSKAHHTAARTSVWTMSEIERKCQSLGVSVHTAGQAAWAKVLGCYTGDTALTMGLVLSGRTGLRSSAEKVAFPCLVTLPTVCVLAGSNKELVDGIQARNTAALKHHHTPLRAIQRWLEHPEESFFDAIFVYQKTAAGKDAQAWEVVQEDSNVDYTFSLEIEPTGDDHLLIRATAAVDVVPAEQTVLILAQYEAALIDILDNPLGLATDLSTIPEALLSITPAAVKEIRSDVGLLHGFVEAQAAARPDTRAFEFVSAIQGDAMARQTWSYQQLNAEGNKIANFLLTHGKVSTGDLVGICFEKCPEASFAILGILKAGCGYVAIDSSAPIDRKAFIVEDSGAVLVLTQNKFLHELKGRVAVPVVAAATNSHINSAATTNPGTIKGLTPEGLCYCLYTSGTTGTPKGCLLTHRNAVQAILSFQRLFAPYWDSSSKFLQFASFHFDVSVLEQYFPWSVGITVTSAPRDLIFEDLAGTLRKLGITHLDLTPSLAALITPEEVPSLKKGVFITGGEALRQEILDAWGATGAIYNGYGPTEVTIGCTMYPRVPANGKPSNIGPAFDNVGTYVLHPETELPVPRGAIGELCAAGPLVGKGYLNRPELTTEKFPVLQKYNERVYRTGDLVRILADGSFDFIGRADDQVKLRGQRLEIGEINAVVKKASPEVQSVATLVLKHPKQAKDQLISFVVLTKDKSDEVEVDVNREYGLVIAALVAECKAKLPAYMVPTHFVPVTKMPLNINNKVDHKELRRLYEATTLEELQLLAKVERRESPQVSEEGSEHERKVRGVLAEVTGLPKEEISNEATIFELGLDSVSVVGLARRLRKAGFEGATAGGLMQHPTIADIIARLETVQTEKNELLEETRHTISDFTFSHAFPLSEELALDPGLATVLPCTPLQEAVLTRFHSSLTSTAYFTAFPMLLAPSTSIDHLRESWELVIDHTPILRTCFAETPDGWAQLILHEAPMHLEVVVLASEDYSFGVQKGLERAGHRFRNKRTAPPLSMVLLITPSEKRILSLNIFHALYDGTSLPFILEDVQKAYLTPRLFEGRKCQFADVLPWILAVDMEGARAFFERNVSVPSARLVGREMKGAGEGARDEMVDETIPESPELAQLCKALNCTVQAVFQTVWASVLSRYLGTVATMGVVVSGRNYPLDDVETVIGPTFNTIPCSVNLGAASWEEVICEVHRVNTEAIPYHNTPLRLVHKWFGCTAEEPLFESLLVYQKDVAVKQGEDEGQKLWELVDGVAVADYPLALDVTQTVGGELKLTMVAKAGLFTAKNVKALLEAFKTQLHEVVTDVSSAPFVPEVVMEEEEEEVVEVHEEVREIQEEQVQEQVQEERVQEEHVQEEHVQEEHVQEEVHDREVHDSVLSDHSDHSGVHQVEKVQEAATLPVTPSGERSAACTPDRGPHPKPVSDFTWDPDASYMRSMIAQLAQVDEGTISPDSSILEVGLDSIEAIKLSSRLRRRGMDMPVSTLMRNPSIRKMTRAMTSASLDAPSMSAAEIIAEFEKKVRRKLPKLKGIAAVYPTTPLQEAMIAETLASDYALYFNHDVLKLENWVDLERLRIAWKTVVKRNDILRTSFVPVEDDKDTYAQLVHGSADCYWSEFTVSKEKYVSEAVETIQRQMSTQADLLCEPPVYISVIRTPKSTRMVLSISHALYDGWSLGLLHQDVRRAYFDVLEPRPQPRLLLENIIAADFDAAKKFWKRLLNGVVTSSFTQKSDVPDTHRFERRSEVSFAEAQQFCKRVGTTMQTLGQVCWGLLLAHSLGETDVVFGTVLSGRDFEGADEIMFPAMNTVPVRTILNGSYREVLKYVQDNGAETLRHQYTPLREIQVLVNSDGNKLFDTLFLYQRGEGGRQKEKSLYHSIGGSSDVEYNVAVEMERSGANITWRTACKASVFDGEQTESLLKDLDSLLAHIINEPDHPAVTLSRSGLVIGSLPPVQVRAQTSLNGIRVDLDQIATVISEGLKGVEGCAMAVVNNGMKDTLVAFVSGPDAEDAISEIFDMARLRLPYWSAPTYVVPVDRIPMKGGRVNREHLRKVFTALPEADKHGYQLGEPTHWTVMESRIRGVLSKVAGIPEADIQKSQTIFHLGLDSISAIRLSADLRKEGINLGVAEILRQATVERMARSSDLVGNAISASVDTASILRKSLQNFNLRAVLEGLSESQVEQTLPLTAGQLYCLCAWKNSGYSLFMPTFTFRCRRVDLGQIQYAWETLVKQEPILRTVFRSSAGEDMSFVQVILKKPGGQFGWYQTSDVPDHLFLKFIKEQEQNRKFDMLLPPVRLCALDSPKETVLFLTMHHALYDGVSLPLLLSKLQALLELQPSRLPTPDLDAPRFPTFVALAQSQDTVLQQRFWSRYLEGAHSTVISARLVASKRSQVYLPAAYKNSRTLEARCRKAGVTLQSVFLAAFAKAYLEHLGCSRDELVFGLYLSNRHFDITDIAAMAAPTLNIVPLRITAIRTTSLVELSKKIQDDLAAISAVQNAVVDLRRIEKWTGITVDCFFNFMKMPASLVPAIENTPQNGGGVLVNRPAEGAVLLEEIKVESDAPGRREVSGDLFRMRRDLDNIRTNMDVEVAVRGGNVDVGMFSKELFFGTEELRAMIEEMCQTVDEVEV